MAVSSNKILPYRRRYLKFDIPAGVVVFLVAIPLCLGIALAAGAPLFSGIIAGIIGGIVVGSISESSVSVSGPAAGLVAVVISAIGSLGGFQSFLLALVIAGLLQIIIGVWRAGFIADYIPSSVIQGLLCAIGILIVIKQLPIAFTHVAQNGALMGHLKDASENFSLEPLLKATQHINSGAAIMSALSIVLLIFFDRTKVKGLTVIPGPIVVVIVAIIINKIYSLFSPGLEQFSSQLVKIPVADTWQGFTHQFQFPSWANWKDPNVYWQAFIIAAVVSLETLLNLEAAEKLDKRKRYCSRNRELIAQGVGNTLSGLIGGIPITSVVVRSSVNVQMRARTKLSTILHGLLILSTVFFIPNVLNCIPLAALASILIYVGYKLTKLSIYQHMYRLGWSQFIPFIVTVIAIVFTNLLLGILIGLFFGFFFILKSNSQIRLDVINEIHPSGVVTRIVLPQQLSFLRKASLIAEFDAIPGHSQLIIDARYTEYIDKDILELINEFVKTQAVDREIALNLIGFKEKYELHDQVDFINVTTYDIQSSLNSKDVLEILKEGNQRFIKDQRIHRSMLQDLKVTARMQYPLAVVLGCIDSRVPIETIFDVGVGDVFVARIAGNVVNDDILASIEFACHIAGAKLILVLGHTRCGAIKAACDDVEGGYLPQLLKKIEPALLAEKEKPGYPSETEERFLLNVTKTNAANTMKNLYQKSVILNRLINEKSIGLISAIYDVSTGMVQFDESFYPLEDGGVASSH